MNSAPVEPEKADRPANDALLAQLVRGALGRSGRGTSGINVSSCSFVVTLHGSVGSVEERDKIGKIRRRGSWRRGRDEQAEGDAGARGCFRRHHSGYLGVSRKDTPPRWR